MCQAVHGVGPRSRPQTFESMPLEPSSTPLGLLERDDELATLDRVVRAATRGVGALAVVSGQAGIGKSSLLDVVATRANTAGLQVLRARASSLEQDFTFGIVHQVFGPLVLGSTPEVTDRWYRGAASGSRKIVESPAPVADEEVPLQASLQSLYWLLVNVSSESPTVVVVDDLQWADEASARWLGFVAARVSGFPIGLVVGTRTTEPRNNRVLAELRRQSGCLVVSPRALTADAVRELVSARFETDVDAAFADACWTATGGIPFTVRSLLDDLVAEGIVPTAANAVRIRDVHPEAVTWATLTRIARAAGTSLGSGPGGRRARGIHFDRARRRPGAGRSCRRYCSAGRPGQRGDPRPRWHPVRASDPALCVARRPRYGRDRPPAPTSGTSARGRRSTGRSGRRPPLAHGGPTRPVDGRGAAPGCDDGAGQRLRRHRSPAARTGAGRAATSRGPSTPSSRSRQRHSRVRAPGGRRGTPAHRVRRRRPRRMARTVRSRSRTRVDVQRTTGRGRPHPAHGGRIVRGHRSRRRPAPVDRLVLRRQLHQRGHPRDPGPRGRVPRPCRGCGLARGAAPARCHRSERRPHQRACLGRRRAGTPGVGLGRAPEHRAAGLPEPVRHCLRARPLGRPRHRRHRDREHARRRAPAGRWRGDGPDARGVVEAAARRACRGGGRRRTGGRDDLRVVAVRSAVLPRRCHGGPARTGRQRSGGGVARGAPSGGRHPPARPRRPLPVRPGRRPPGPGSRRGGAGRLPAHR